MSTVSFTYNGNFYSNCDIDDLVNEGIPQSIIDDAIVDSKWKHIRAKRDGLLNTSDWAVMPDSPVADQQAWLDYRTALRNIPQTYSADPDSVVWPVAP